MEIKWKAICPVAFRMYIQGHISIYIFEQYLLLDNKRYSFELHAHWNMEHVIDIIRVYPNRNCLNVSTHDTSVQLQQSIEVQHCPILQ
jgi:hypothetical protein